MISYVNANNSVSIFFDSKELSSIRNVIQKKYPDLKKHNSSYEEEYINLEAILFFTPKKWTIFINGNCVTPNETPFNNFTIKKVTPAQITIQTKYGKIFSLRSGQNIDLETGKKSMVSSVFPPVKNDTKKDLPDELQNELEQNPPAQIGEKKPQSSLDDKPL